MRVNLTADQAWDMIDTLMEAAGRLSDIQEGLRRGSDISDALNAAKSKIFDVTHKLDPRQQGE